MTVNYYEPPQMTESPQTNESSPINGARPSPTPPVPPAGPKRPGRIRRIFGAIGGGITWFRNTLMNIFFLLILLLLIAAIGSNAPKPLPDHFALRIAPSGILVDQRSYTDPASLLLSEDDPQDSETVVRDLVEAINKATTDDRVTMIVIEPGNMLAGGISKLNEIGQALRNFKASGKKVVAAADYYSQDQYYLASFADEIYMHEMGAIELTGYGRFMSYYKTALDKLGITIHAFRSGKYKDFLEPFLRDDMSEESREHNSEWINSLWGAYSAHIESARKLEPGALKDYINNMDAHLALTSGDAAKLTLEKGLVDKLLSRQDIERELVQLAGKNNEDDGYKGVDVKAYLADARLTPELAADKVGLIVASGTISDGEQPDGAIGGDTMLELLRQVQKDDAIKALVIRVDSGGGSAFASEIIRSEIMAVRNKGTPVFISMGSVAASGGYWISTAADQIWALPTTITGSIGVFGAFPTMEKTLQRMGINSDGVATTELAGSMSIARPLSPKIKNIVQQGVDNIYQRFIKLVADSRAQTPEQIDVIAQGHVWTGSKALELGLVDKLGTLQDTIVAVAEKAELKEYKVELIERPLSPQEAFLRELANGSASALTPKTLLEKFSSLQMLNDLSPVLKPLHELATMRDPQGIYVKCLECVAL